MKRTLSALAALLACTAHAQDEDPARSAPVWRVVVSQVTIAESGHDAVKSLTLDVPDDQCRVGTMKGYDHRSEPNKIKLCAGKIDGLSAVTGWVMPYHVQQAVAAGKTGAEEYESFSFGFNGTKAVLKAPTYTVSVTKL